MADPKPPHIVIVAFPIQSHLNPVLQFAHRLLPSAHVTIATTISATSRISNSNTSPPPNLSFSPISDGFDHSQNIPSFGSDTYLSSFNLHGSLSLSSLISAASPPVTCVVHTFLLTWASHVARQHDLPSALLWIQSASLLSIYYRYFNGYGNAIDECDENDPLWCVELPSLPPLHARDLPSYILPSVSSFTCARESLREQFEGVGERERPVVLVNTFDQLERGVMELVRGVFDVLAIGPLFQSMSGFRVEMFEGAEVDYMAWLDAMGDGSVVYVSFGSVVVLSAAQLEELAAALLDSGRPFLWVIRGVGTREKEKLSRWEEVRGKGFVVPWCSQVEVLSHRAVGCFVMHCGWNSTLESLAAGVPVVAMPQRTDQLTNAKMLESVWGMGVRVRVKGTGADEKVVGREEVRHCVEEVMESEEMRRNVRRWREKAVEAAKEGGSSEGNIIKFVQKVFNA